MSRSRGFAALAFVLLASAAAADIVVNSGHGGELCSSGSIGQSFIARDSKPTLLYLWPIKTHGDSQLPAVPTVHIHAGTLADPIVASATADRPLDIVQNGWVRFELPGSTSLSTGAFYTFELAIDGDVCLALDATSGYSAGNALLEGQPVLASDLRFMLLVEDVAGACCLGGGCLANVLPDTCTILGGNFAGSATTCPGACRTGACCTALGDCYESTRPDCSFVFGWDFSACGKFVCPTAEGGCCLDDFCVDGQQRSWCESAGGAWLGNQGCDASFCPICTYLDWDVDADLDLADYAAFQTCYGPVPSAECECFNAGTDPLIDGGDFAAFIAEFTGPAVSSQLVNDSCFNAVPVTEETREFANLGANTDGLPAASCEFFDNNQVDSDLWYCYTASCTDTVVVSLCGSEFDTKVNVYHGCDCPGPTEVPLRCNDDGCGVSYSSRETFNAVEGQQYLIRVGGFLGGDPPNHQGNGTLTIFCQSNPDQGANACISGQGDCFTSHANAGCFDQGVCQATCGASPYCCDTTWSQACAATADGIVNGFPACDASAEPCETGGSTPGCNDVACCQAICEQDPFCCLNTWDDFCAGSIGDVCGIFPACGSSTESCFMPHAGVGCETQNCCEAVCGGDSFCCTSEWDDLCVNLAQNLCR